MGLGIGCLYCCAPFTLIASVLLFMLAVMLRSGNWTFEVLAAKHDWDRSAKSKACRNGAIIYLCISLVLWVLVLLDAYVLYLEKLPDCVAALWRRRQLPRWRDLRRSQATSKTRANPAVDVVVSALSAAPAVLQPAAAQGEDDQEPADLSHTVAPVESLTTPLIVSSPLLGQQNRNPSGAPMPLSGKGQ